MKLGEEVPPSHRPRVVARRAVAELARSRALFPKAAARDFVRLAAKYWRVLMLLVGILVQVVLTVLMWQLVDLSISLFEVWAELARKHLEITLA